MKIRGQQLHQLKNNHNNLFFRHFLSLLQYLIEKLKICLVYNVNQFTFAKLNIYIY
jgi:hypothetical protein